MAPMMKVAEITMSGFTPISAGHARVLGRGAHGAAQLGVVDQVHQAARMAVTPRIMIWVGVITAPPTSNGRAGSRVG
jgi:hypothetical protein